MGEAATRKAFEAKEVIFDFGAPKLAIGPADRQNLTRTSTENPVSQAVKMTMNHVISQIYGKEGMKQVESASDHWEVWQEFVNTDQVLIDKGLTVGDIVWLIDTIQGENLAVGWGFNQWTKALLRYLKGLKKAVEDTPTDEHKLKAVEC